MQFTRIRKVRFGGKRLEFATAKVFSWTCRETQCSSESTSSTYVPYQIIAHARAIKSCDYVIL